MADNWNRDMLYADLIDGIQHGVRVSNLTYLTAKKIGLSEDLCYEYAVAGMVHDIGKLKLSSYLYGRNSKAMLIEEMQYMRKHSELGYDILKEHGFSDVITEAVLYHHENYDGTGYPSNLKEEKIPIGARIIKVVDEFVALISERPYRAAFSVEDAVKIMIEEIREFDMRVFLAFLEIIHDEKVLNDVKKRDLIIDFDMEDLL